jgi:preprotein translocase subunit YajC
VLEYLGLVLPVLAGFYFILLRPVLEQQKRRRRDISRLNVGDEVLTTGGFYAVVRDIQTREHGPLELTLEVAPGVQLRATADAIASVTTPDAAAASRTGARKTGDA